MCSSFFIQTYSILKSGLFFGLKVLGTCNVKYFFMKDNCQKVFTFALIVIPRKTPSLIIYFTNFSETQRTAFAIKHSCAYGGQCVYIYRLLTYKKTRSLINYSMYRSNCRPCYLVRTFKYDMVEPYPHCFIIYFCGIHDAIAL